MPTRPLLASLLLATSVNASALDTASVPETTLLALGSQLESHAGSSQWQQLWQRTRAAGHFTPGTPGAFSLSQEEIPPLVRATLAAADSATPHKGTQALYRRNFHPLVTGRQGQVSLSGLCLWVDWRTLGERVPDNPTPHLTQISLLTVHPCA